MISPTLKGNFVGMISYFSTTKSFQKSVDHSLSLSLSLSPGERSVDRLASHERRRNKLDFLSFRIWQLTGNFPPAKKPAVSPKKIEFRVALREKKLLRQLVNSDLFLKKQRTKISWIKNCFCTLRIMGSHDWCFGDPNEYWYIQSQTPLFRRVQLLILRARDIEIYCTLPETNSKRPLKTVPGPQKERIVFQPAIFRRYCMNFRCKLFPIGSRMVYLPTNLPSKTYPIIHSC